MLENWILLNRWPLWKLHLEGLTIGSPSFLHTTTALCTFSLKINADGWKFSSTWPWWKNNIHIRNGWCVRICCWVIAVHTLQWCMSQFCLSLVLIEFISNELYDLLTLMICDLNSSYVHSLKRSLLRECHVMR